MEQLFNRTPSHQDASIDSFSDIDKDLTFKITVLTFAIVLNSIHIGLNCLWNNLLWKVWQQRQQENADEQEPFLTLLEWNSIFCALSILRCFTVHFWPIFRRILYFVGSHKNML